MPSIDEWQRVGMARGEKQKDGQWERHETRARGDRPESPEVTQDSWDLTIVERGFEPKCTFVITYKVTPAS